MSGRRVDVGSYRTPPPIPPGELAELRGAVVDLGNTISEIGAELRAIRDRLARIERAAAVAAGDRGDRAVQLADLVRRLDALERGEPHR